ncbi:MAG: AraC family transcriptional regulator [Porphyromonas sp.]|uniref:helix-turn-helix domain-containing protein n=1 Tax=Porphyromonas sp. TaxID=1924944 RepID=UPI001CAC0DEE|nr:helix-turn-helix domain-containing protein [Porphyromonas sp.]MBF1371114.1 AraC family transcriptional regulator [Porphyromonas sp.]
MQPHEWTTNDFKGDPGIDYCHDKLLFANSLHTLPERMIGARMRFGMAIYCSQGTALITVDGLQYRLKQGQRLSYQEGSLIEECLASSDADLVLMGLSWEIIQSTEALNTLIWPIADYVRRSPIYTLSEEALSLTKIYHQQIYKLCHSPNPLFRDELLHIHIQALLYAFIREVGEELHQATPQDLTRASQQARLFFDLLAMRRGRIRSVSEVATQMNLTPKHLSRIIKEQTGETPIHFIHQYMMRAITQELRYSSKTAKEIACQQGFSSLAFFGKFVKQQTGLTPTEYRKKLQTGEGATPS